jgi:hypothetical protein
MVQGMPVFVVASSSGFTSAMALVFGGMMNLE